MSVLDFQTENNSMSQMLITIRENFAKGKSILLVGETGTGKTLLTRNLEKMRKGTPILVLENIQALSISRRREIATRAKSGEFQVVATATQKCPELCESFLVFEIPALRDRPEDIELLAKFFVQVQSHLKASPSVSLSVKAIEKLKSYAWPKNVHELETVMDRATTICSFRTITEDDIFFEVEEASGYLGLSLAEMEKRLILQTLEITEQNRTRAAEILGISIRTLRNKLNEYRGGVSHESDLR